jgi:hemolysin III
VTAKPTRRFSIVRFTLLVLLQLAVLFVGLHFAFPGLWRSQIAAGALALVSVFVAFHLLFAFFEWFFHRYVLHFVTTPLLQKFAREHRLHHSLTAIRLRPTSEGSHRVILNEYPITQPEQFESSAFPFYALAAFWAFFTPLLLAVQLALPELPVLLGGYAAIAWSLALYEVLHAINHWPYEWWQRAIDHPRLGAFWRMIYGFHLMHHANNACNEAIAGFFSLPLPDWCFGTYHQPKQLLLEGRQATAQEFQVGPPFPFVRRLDRWARGREARIQRRAATGPAGRSSIGGTVARKDLEAMSSTKPDQAIRRPVGLLDGS